MVHCRKIVFIIYVLLIILHLNQVHLWKVKVRKKNNFNHGAKLHVHKHQRQHLAKPCHTQTSTDNKHLLIKGKNKNSVAFAYPKNEIFGPMTHWADVVDVKRDFLVFPQQLVTTSPSSQLFVNSLIPKQQISANHRQPSVFFDDPLLKNQGSYSFLTPARSSFPGYDSPDLSNQDPDQMTGSPSNNKVFYDEPFPPEFKDMQGLQDSEELLVGKIVGHVPKGTSSKISEQPDPPIPAQPPPLPPYNENHYSTSSHVDNMLLEKILAPQYNSQISSKFPDEYKQHSTKIFHEDSMPKLSKEINCDPVQLSEVANCSNSADPLCKDDDLGTFRANGLHQHQTFRRIHLTPPLELNNMLNMEAQNYSDELANAPKLAYSDPRDRPGQGENIAVRCSDDSSMLSAKEAVSYWYNKACKEDKSSMHFSPEITQFAQLVWKNTNFLGMGRTSKKKGDLLCTYIVARYSPQATKDGFAENVPQFDSRKICANQCMKDSIDHSLDSKVAEEGHKFTQNTFEDHARLATSPHEAIFNKMKDITDEDRQHLRARNDNFKLAAQQSSEFGGHPSIGYHYTTSSADQLAEKNVKDKKVEINAEVRHSGTEPINYTPIIHTHLSFVKQDANKEKVLGSRTKTEETLDLSTLDDTVNTVKKPAEEDVLDLSSPKPAQQNRGTPNAQLSHSSTINADNSAPAHPESVSDAQKHRNPIKERAHEMFVERAEQQKEDEKENEKYIEQLHRHHERVKEKSEEQKYIDREKGTNFMNRFLTPGGGSPNFEATAAIWREGSRKKKRKRRKKIQDDEDDDESIEKEETTADEHQNGKETSSLSRMKPKKMIQLREESTLVNPHAPEDQVGLSHNALSASNTNKGETQQNTTLPLKSINGPSTVQPTSIVGRKMNPQVLNAADKLIADAAAKNNLHVKIVLNPKIVSSQLKEVEKRPETKTNVKNQSSVGQGGRIIRLKADADVIHKLLGKNIKIGDQPESIKSKEKEEIKKQYSLNTSKNATTDKNQTEISSKETGEKSGDKKVGSGKLKLRLISNNNEEEKTIEKAKYEKTSNKSEDESSEKAEELKKQDAIEEDRLNKDPNEPEFEKGSDAELQYKINKKVNKVLPVDSYNAQDDNNEKVKVKEIKNIENAEKSNEKQESTESSDFKKVGNILDKEANEELKAMAHFEDIGEENEADQHLKLDRGEDDPALSILSNERESKSDSVNNNSTESHLVTPVPILDAKTADAKTADGKTEEKPEIMIFINGTQKDNMKGQQAAFQQAKERHYDEEDLPVFQEVSDARIPNNEEADINELSKQARMKPTKTSMRTGPGLRISKLTRDGLVDLTILEKTSPKTSDPATRHMLQTIFDNINFKQSDPSSSYIQLIPAKDLNEFRREMVDQHNRYRGIHVTPPLHLDKELSKDAQSYAAYVAKHNSVAHSDPKDRPDIGESVAEMCTKEGVLPTAEHIVAKWYSEICNPGFDFKKIETKQPGTGHFTQIIWKDTDKLGVGLAVANHPNGDSCSYVVARYKNAGNYLDKFKENVQDGYFTVERCSDSIEPNVPVINRATLAHAYDNGDITASVRAMKGHTPKRKTQTSSEKLSEGAKKPMVQMKKPMNNQKKNRKFKNDEPKRKVNFQIREDAVEEPQSKSVISRYNHARSFNFHHPLQKPQSLEKRSTIERRYEDLRRKYNSLREKYKRRLNEDSFAEDVIERRSKIKHRHVKGSKKQNVASSNQFPPSSNDPSTIVTPVQSIIINQGQPSLEDTEQSMSLRHDTMQEAYSQVPVSPVQPPFALQSTQPLPMQPAAYQLPSLSPVLTLPNVAADEKNNNQTGLLDNSQLLEQDITNFQSPVPPYKSVGQHAERNNENDTSLVRQNLAVPQNETEDKIDTQNMTTVEEKPKVLINETEEVRTAEQLGIPEAMMPIIDHLKTKATLAKASRNRTLPDSILEHESNKTVADLLPNVTIEPKEQNTSKKFLVPKVTSADKLQNIRMNKKEVENEIDHFFKTQLLHKAKPNRRITNKRHRTVKTLRKYAKKMRFKLKPNSSKRLYNNQPKDTLIFGSVKKHVSRPLLKNKSKQHSKKRNSSNDSDLTKYLNNIVIKLHDIGRNESTEEETEVAGHKRTIESSKENGRKRLMSYSNMIPSDPAMARINEVNTVSHAYPQRRAQSTIHSYNVDEIRSSYSNTENDDNYKKPRDVENVITETVAVTPSSILPQPETEIVALNSNLAAESVSNLVANNQDNMATMEAMKSGQLGDNFMNAKLHAQRFSQEPMDDSAFGKYKASDNSLAEMPVLKPLHAISKELEKEVQRIPAQEIKDSNHEAKVVATHLASSLAMQDPRVASPIQKPKEEETPSTPLPNTHKSFGNHDDLNNNDAVTHGRRHIVKDIYSEGNNDRLTENIEKLKRLRLLKGISKGREEEEKISDSEDQRYDENRKIEYKKKKQRVMRKFNDAFLKEAARLIKESSDAISDKSKKFQNDTRDEEKMGEDHVKPALLETGSGERMMDEDEMEQTHLLHNEPAKETIGDTQMQQSALIAINQFRSLHQAPHLYLNEKLSHDAQSYAEELVSENDGVLVPSNIAGRSDEGENLFIDCDPHQKILTGKKAAEKWYKEICEQGYNFDTEPTHEQMQATSHFTQTVWRSSKYVGLGMITTQKNKMTCTIIVARFKPAGNIPKMFSSNVFEGRFDASICDTLKSGESLEDAAIASNEERINPTTYLKKKPNNALLHQSDDLLVGQKLIIKPGVPKLNEDRDEDEKLPSESLRRKHKNADEDISVDDKEKQEETRETPTESDDDEERGGEEMSNLDKARQTKLARKVKEKMESITEKKKESQFADNREEEYMKKKKEESKNPREGKKNEETKSPVTLENVESTNTHLKGSPLDEVDDEPNLKSIRNKELSDEENIKARNDGIQTDSKSSKMSFLKDISYLGSVLPKNESDDTDSSILLWNKDEAGKSHVAVPLIRRADTSIGKQHDTTTSLNIYTDHGAYKVKANKMDRMKKTSERVGKQSKDDDNIEDALDDKKQPDVITYLGDHKNDTNTGPTFLNVSLNDEKHKGDEGNDVSKYKSHAEEQMEKGIVGVKENDHLKPKPNSKAVEEEVNKNEEEKKKTENKGKKANSSSKENNDILDEQDEAKEKATDMKYESPSGQFGKKKPTHTDSAHNEHAQTDGNNEQPTRAPPTGLRGHGNEELADGAKPMIAGMLDEDPTKKPSLPTTVYETHPKPITSASPTIKPLAIPRPHPISSSLDINSKLVQTLGPWPSLSFSSFGSPVVLHLGATGFFEDSAAFIRIGLSTHNKLRKIHGSPPMIIDPELTRMAYQHASALTDLGYLKHESLRRSTMFVEMNPNSAAASDNIGENLFLGCYDGEYDISAEEAVMRWYAEVCSPGHCFNKTTQCSGTGHFSQVIWVSSTKLGMAKATRMQNGLRCTYIVAKYYPEGNEHIEYNKNVLQGKFKEKETCHDVVETLVTFETRNADKAKMVEKEKNLAREEFLKSLRDAEEQVTENLHKEKTNHDYVSGSNLQTMKEGLPFSNNENTRVDQEEFKESNKQGKELDSAPLTGSTKLTSLSLNKLEESLRDIYKDDKDSKISEDKLDVTSQKKIKSGAPLLTMGDPLVHTVHPEADDIEVNGITKTHASSRKTVKDFPNDFMKIDNKLKPPQSILSNDNADETSAKVNQFSPNRKPDPNAKKPKLNKVNTDVEGGSNDPFSRIQPGKIYSHKGKNDGLSMDKTPNLPTVNVNVSGGPNDPSAKLEEKKTKNASPIEQLSLVDSEENTKPNGEGADKAKVESSTISLKIECKIGPGDSDNFPHLPNLGGRCQENDPSRSFHGAISGDISLFQLSALNAHNAYRHVHDAPSLILNEKMANEATEYAKQIAKVGSLRHSGTEDGENIATVCRNKDVLMTGQEASTIWYREVCDPGYDFSTSLPGKAGHFTQVVWKGSKVFGIGRASEYHNGLLCTYIVARYRPAGNFIGEFAENVLRGHFRSPHECLNLARKRSGIRFPRSIDDWSNETGSSDDNDSSDVKDSNDVKDSSDVKDSIAGTINAFTNPNITTKLIAKINNNINGFIAKRQSAGKRGQVTSKDENYVELKIKKQNKRVSVVPLSQVEVTFKEAKPKTYLKREKYAILPGNKKSKEEWKSDYSKNHKEDNEGNDEKEKWKDEEKKDDNKSYQDDGYHRDHATDNRDNNGYEHKNDDFHDNEYNYNDDDNHSEDKYNSTRDSQERHHYHNVPDSDYDGYQLPGYKEEVNNDKEDVEGYLDNVLKDVADSQIHNFPSNQELSGLTYRSKCANCSNSQKRDVNYPTYNRQVSVELAQKIGEALLVSNRIGENKQEMDEPLQSSIFSPLFEEIGMKSMEEDLPASVLNNTEELVKMAKIGNMALNLARRKDDLKRKMLGEQKIDPSLSNLVNNLMAGKKDNLHYDDISKYIPQNEQVIHGGMPDEHVTHDDQEPNSLLGDHKPNVGTENSTQEFSRERPDLPAQVSIPTDVAPKPNDVKNIPHYIAVLLPTDLAAKTINEVTSQINPDKVELPFLSKVPADREVDAQAKTFDSHNSLDTEFAQATLSLHNAYRSLHEAEPLVLNTELMLEAKERADYLAEKGALRKSEIAEVDGENVAILCKDARSGELMTGPDATMTWYNSVCAPFYVFGIGRPQSKPFSQVVWKDSKQLGVARSTFNKKDKKCTVIIAKYAPSWEKTQVLSNVLKGDYDEKSYCDGLGSIIPTGSNKIFARMSVPGRKISQNTQDFRQEALNLQNEFRSVHGTKALTLDDALCMTSEFYATKLAEQGGITRSSTDDGENMVKSCTLGKVEMTADEAVRKWYNEICNPGYNFQSEEPMGGTNSFSQMIWRDTNRFGIGKATAEEDGMLCTYIVARYNSRGNIPGLFKENVIKGQFDFGYCESFGKARRLSRSSQTNAGWKRHIKTVKRKTKHHKRAKRQADENANIEDLMLYNRDMS